MKTLLILPALLLAITAHAQPIIITSPVNATAAASGTVSFSVSASGAAPLAYQWLRVGTNMVNGSPAGRATITGATSSILTLTTITTNDESSYSCRVTNASGSVTSSIASLAVIVPPRIITQPLSYNVSTGATVTFSVAATGTAPLYQWRTNGADIAGATLNSWTVSHVATNNSGTTYSVYVHNSAGNDTSANGVLNVGIAPVITIPPSALIVTQGQSATFIVTASGTPLNYFWRKNGTLIPGATNSSLAFASVVASNAANYTCQVSNFLGSVQPGAVLTVLYPPVITTQPVGQTLGVGSNFTVTVTANGVPAPAYQWRANGTVIAGATATIYTLSGAQTNNAGNYDVVITNSQGSITSSAAILNLINYSPTMVTQPAGGNAAVGGSFSLSASANGTAPLSWQWRYNGASIPAARTNQYVLNPVQLADAGSYDVVVTNIAGAVTSSVASVNVGYAPVFVQQPQSLTNSVGGTANFSCIVTGSAPINGQWTLSGNALPGMTNDTLAVTNLQPNNIGYYALTATNIFGSAVSSNAALNLNGYNFSQWAGLVAYYPLNGNANDASGNGNHGTNFGASFASDRFGNENGAFSFAGGGQYVQCKTGAYFGSNYTVTAWVNAAAYNNFSRILDFGNGGPSYNTDLALSGGTSGKPYFEVYIGNVQIGNCASPSAIPLNTWIQVVGTCDGTQISLYFNGIMQNQVNVQLNRQPVTTVHNYLGKSNWANDQYFAGRFDDIRIYNRALSSNEVTQLYALESQTTLMPPNLSGSLMGGSNFSLSLPGQPGFNYVLQTATNLAATSQWQSIFTNAADTNWLWQFTDSNLNNARKFYRVVTP